MFLQVLREKWVFLWLIYCWPIPSILVDVICNNSLSKRFLRPFLKWFALGTEKRLISILLRFILSTFLKLVDKHWEYIFTLTKGLRMIRTKIAMLERPAAYYIAQKMKFSFKDFCSKFEEIRRKLRLIWTRFYPL